MYFIESRVQPEAFSSIPATLWWGVVILTTVGYGDVYPVTALGKLSARSSRYSGSVSLRFRHRYSRVASSREPAQHRGGLRLSELWRGDRLTVT
nr:potassium channel family protein [Halostella sp. PRR32]